MRCVWVGSFVAGVLAVGSAESLARQTPPAAAGQTPPPAAAQPPASRPAFDENMWRNICKQRAVTYEPLYAEIYSLNDEQKAKLKKIIEETNEADIKYSRETHDAKAATRDEMSRLMREMMAARREQKSEEEIKQIDSSIRELQNRNQEVFRNQPWDLDKIAAAIEKVLPPEQAKLGHEQFLKRKPYGLRQVPVAATQPVMPPNMPPQPQQPLTPQTAQPTRYRAVNRVAPPVEQWNKEAETVAADRKYDADQTAKVKLLITNAKGRAEAHRKDKAAAYEEARKMTDAAARDAEIKKLDQEYNLLYDELMLRVDHVARADQLPSKVTTAPAMPKVITPVTAGQQPGVLSPGGVPRPVTSTQPGHEGHNHP